jgi:hypothetical protein
MKMALDCIEMPGNQFLLRVLQKNAELKNFIRHLKMLLNKKTGAVQKEKFTVVEVLETTSYSVNGHFDRLNDRSY